MDWGTNTERETVSGHWEGGSANSTGRLIKEQLREFLLNVTAETALVSGPLLISILRFFKNGWMKGIVVLQRAKRVQSNKF